MLSGFLDVLDLMLPLSTNKQSWGGDLSFFAKAVPWMYTIQALHHASYM
jgi:hypothetical protein